MVCLGLSLNLNNDVRPRGTQGSWASSARAGVSRSHAGLEIGRQAQASENTSHKPFPSGVQVPQFMAAFLTASFGPTPK